MQWLGCKERLWLDVKDIEYNLITGLMNKKYYWKYEMFLNLLAIFA